MNIKKKCIKDLEHDICNLTDVKQTLEKENSDLKKLMSKVISSINQNNPYFINNKNDHACPSIIFPWQDTLKEITFRSFLSSIEIYHFDASYFVYIEKYNGKDYMWFVDKETGKHTEISSLVRLLNETCTETIEITSIDNVTVGKRD